MMNQSKNGKAWRWKVATFLPLLALLLMAFGKEGENLQKDSPSQKEMLNQEKSIVTEPSTQPKDSIYSTPEIMPQFPGGEEAIRKFIIENIHYPEEKAQMKEYLKEKPLLEKGFVTFSINSKGKVINIKLVKSIKNVLDAEAVKAIPLMPNWIPAKDKGKPVSASYTIPFDFILWPDPQANKGEKIVPPPSPIPTLKIEIRKDGNYIDNRLFSLEEIRKKAEEFQKSNPNGVTSLKMDKDVSQERVNETREILKNVKVMVDDPRASNSQQLSIDGHKSNVAPPPPPPLLKIDIKKDGNYVDGHLLSLEEIRKKAEAYQKSNPNAVVSLKVEKEVPLERVNEVKEVLRQAKIQNINKSSSATSASNMAPSLIIECKSNGIYVDDQLSTLEELRLKAREWKNQNPKGNVGLYESKGAQIPYTKVIDVLFSEKIKSINTTIRSEDEDNLFTYNDVTQKPIFAKGNFDEWIGKEIGKLHDKYNKYNNFGFIYSFIINENGDIKGITVKGMGVDRKDINQEFEAILTQMPAWSPGQHKGQAVKVKYARANGMQYTKDFKPDKEES